MADGQIQESEWRRQHVDGCAAPFVSKECDCPPARLYVPLDAVIALLENAYAPQGPLTMHPADFLTKRYELRGHEGLEYV